MLMYSSGGQEGVTAMDTGDTLCDVDLLVIVMLLPAAGGETVFLFIIQIPIRHMRIMPVTTAELMIIGHFIRSKRGVTNTGVISA